MNAAQIAQLVALAEQLFPLTVQLINSLRDAGVPTKTVEELLAQANANADSIIATAQKELPPTA